MKSKKDNMVQPMDKLSGEEKTTLLTALGIYAELCGDESYLPSGLVKKIKRGLTRDLIKEAREEAQMLFDHFASYHFEENRNYEYDHDHRWDWKTRYIEVPPEMEQLLVDCWQKRKTIWMEYVSNSSAKDEERITKREVDIYNIDGGYFSGFCHLRNEERTFRMDRIVSVRPTKKKYIIGGVNE